MLKKSMTKLRLIVFTFLFGLCNIQLAFATGAQGVANEGITSGMRLVAIIPAAMGIFAFINAGIAFSQSQQEGGNAQASAKMSNSIVAGVVCMALAIFVATKGTTMVQGLLTFE